MAQEIEIKLAATPGDLARLTNSAALRRFAAGKPATERLNSIYYDTPDLRLSRAGLSLRVRKQGRAHIQTLKTQGIGALAATRGEWECRLPSGVPDMRLISDKSLREHVRSIAAEERVEPIIETAIKRTKRRLKTRAGDEIEFAVDSGEIRALQNNRVAVPVSEVELELLKGSPTALFDVARALATEAPLTLNMESKAERGLRAMQGTKKIAHKAGPLALHPEATVEDAFRAALLHSLRHIARNVPVVIEARDPEGVHQLRVGLRRLRVAIGAFGSAFSPEPLSRLRSRAKDLGRKLAHARDLDVFAADLLPQVERAHSGERGLKQLRKLVEKERDACWHGVAKELRSEAFTGFLIDLAAATETRTSRVEKKRGHVDPHALASALASRTLEKRLKKARKLAKKMETSPEKRHALRIELKKLRYTAEIFASLFSNKQVAVFLKDLSDLQDVFGAANDAEMAQSMCKSFPRKAGDSRDRVRAAADLVAEFHEERAGLTWKKAEKRWKKFASARSFWRA